MGSSKLRFLKYTIGNFLFSPFYSLSYIVESENWSIRWDGKYLTSQFNRQKLISARLTTSPIGLRNQIVHFGSFGTFISDRGCRFPHPSNQVVVTFFHLVPNDPKLKFIKESVPRVKVYHTSAHLTKKEMIRLGIPPEKIKVIPLGVDLALFKPVSPAEKTALRRKYGLPVDKFIIGSFQKDGEGWGEGLKPKLIKGPDIFVETIARLKQYKPFVLLTGPARGYVKKRLRQAGISFKHFYLKDYREIAHMYQMLDLYIISSRVEGGPKAILEAWASGVPVVSTKVGMVPDIAKEEKDALLAEVEATGKLVEGAQKVIEDSGLRQELVGNGLKRVRDFSWTKIAQRYFKEIYASFL